MKGGIGSARTQPVFFLRKIQRFVTGEDIEESIKPVAATSNNGVGRTATVGLDDEVDAAYEYSFGSRQKQGSTTKKRREKRQHTPREVKMKKQAGRGWLYLWRNLRTAFSCFSFWFDLVLVYLPPAWVFQMDSAGVGLFFQPPSH